MTNLLISYLGFFGGTVALAGVVGYRMRGVRK